MGGLQTIVDELTCKDQSMVIKDNTCLLKSEASKDGDKHEKINGGSAK